MTASYELLSGLMPLRLFHRTQLLLCFALFRDLLRWLASEESVRIVTQLHPTGAHVVRPYPTNYTTTPVAPRLHDRVRVVSITHKLNVWDSGEPPLGLISINICPSLPLFTVFGFQLLSI